jgi:hypothetical protein
VRGKEECFMTQQELNEIAFKCSQIGASGSMVTAVIMPTLATQSEPIYVIATPLKQSATAAAWHDK